MFSIFLSIFIIHCCFLNQIFCQQKGSISFDSKNITIITKLNEQVSLMQPAFLFAEKAEKWLFGVDTSTKVVFESGELKDKSRFQCKAVVDRCETLTILRTTKNELGQYVRSGTAVDNTKLTFTAFYLSALDTPLDIKCSSLSGLCVYNATTNVLSVKENDQVTLTCTANFWRSDTLYNIPAELFYRSTRNDECTSNENKFIAGTTDPTSTGKAQNMQLKKDCTKSFTNTESGNSFTCGVRYTQTAESIRNDEIERLNIKIDVHYGPISLISSSLQSNEFNKTINKGSTATIKCPYDGNPITYYWKLVSAGQKSNSDEFVGGKEFVTAKDLEPGTYQYQCSAYIGGFINTRTDTAKFTVRIVETQTTTKKDFVLTDNRTLRYENAFILSNLPAIIGGAVGGAVLLIVIIVLVIYLVKCRQSGFKDEVNKTKESKEIPAKKPILRTPKNKNEEAVAKPLNEFNGTDPANNEFESIGDFNKKRPINNSLKNLNETVPLNENNDAPLPSKRGAKQQTPTYPNIINETRTATEMLNNNHDSSDENNVDHKYSVSNAEARRLDAAAPGANVSRVLKENSDTKANLAIKAGGHKVLPTEEDLKLKNQNTGESPPSYDAALKQQPNDSPQLLNNNKPYQAQTPQHQHRQPHYQSQTLLNKEFTNSNLKLNMQQQQQFNSGSTSKIALNGSNKNLNSNIQMNPNGGLMQPSYQPPGLPISNNNNNNNIEYSDVLINRARNREPIPFNDSASQQQQQQQQQQTQYSTIPTFTMPKPSIV